MFLESSTVVYLVSCITWYHMVFCYHMSLGFSMSNSYGSICSHSSTGIRNYQLFPVRQWPSFRSSARTSVGAQVVTQAAAWVGSTEAGDGEPSGDHGLGMWLHLGPTRRASRLPWPPWVHGKISSFQGMNVHWKLKRSMMYCDGCDKLVIKYFKLWI